MWTLEVMPNICRPGMIRVETAWLAFMLSPSKNMQNMDAMPRRKPQTSTSLASALLMDLQSQPIQTLTAGKPNYPHPPQSFRRSRNNLKPTLDFKKFENGTLLLSWSLSWFCMVAQILFKQPSSKLRQLINNTKCEIWVSEWECQVEKGLAFSGTERLAYRM